MIRTIALTNEFENRKSITNLKDDSLKGSLKSVSLWPG